MKPTLDESASILEINEHALDKECVQLPNQYRQAAYNAAETARDIDETKAELEVIEAEFHLRVRAEPEKYGLDKLTEGGIKEATCINPKVQALNKKLRELEHKAAMEDILVKALGFKKTSLSNLVELHGAGYHAQVRPSAQGREAVGKISRERVSRPIAWKNNKDRESDKE